jgi:sugar lactone lactonase YvrE
MSGQYFEILDARFSLLVGSGATLDLLKSLGRIKTPEVVVNVCFGGQKRNYLYMCATTSLYGMRLPVRGARTF